MNPVARFGPYALVRRIAVSDVAISFAARWLPLDDAERVVALRFLTGDATGNPEFAEAFEHAMRVASRLNHVNVAQTFDSAHHGDHWYQALEYVEGVPLSILADRAVASSRPLPTDVATFIAAETCAALGYAHGRRDERGQPLDVIHTDLRPRNILLSRAGEVKVVDFGLARVWLDLTGVALLDEADRLHYAAPELVKGDPWDRRVDVYAAGAIAYTLLCGQRPFEGRTGAELRGAAERGGVTPIREIAPSVPDPLAEIVMAALATDPSLRPATAVEVRSALSAWLRRHAPGFGRHRLKMYLQKELADDMPAGLLDGSWRALHRKDFIAHDRATVLDHEVTERAAAFDARDDLASLLDPTGPDPGAAPAPPQRPAAAAPPLPAAAPPAAPAPAHARPKPPAPAPIRRAETPAAAPPRTPSETPVPGTEAARAPSETPTGLSNVDETPPTYAEHAEASDSDAAPDGLAEAAAPSPDDSAAPAVDTTDDAHASIDDARADDTPVPRAPESGPVRIREDRRALVDEVTGKVAVNANVETFDEALADELAGAVYDDEVAPDFGVNAVREARDMRRAGRRIELKPIIATLVLVAAIVGTGVWAWQRNTSAPGPDAAPAQSDAASVFVTSRPHGAAIRLDGTPTGLSTPAPLGDLSPGQTYNITLELPGYEARAPLSFTAEAGAAPTLSAELQPAAHDLDIITEPPGAQVWYDGRQVGTTPTTLEDLRVDYRAGVELVLRLDGYFDEPVVATWDAGAPSSAVTTVMRPDPNAVPGDDATTAGGR